MLYIEEGVCYKNIIATKARGFGVIDKITFMLDDISFGPNYIDIAILLRSSLFISSVLDNSEVWYGLTLADVERL